MTSVELLDSLETTLETGEQPDDLAGLWNAAGEAYIEEGGEDDPDFLRISELLDHFTMIAHAKGSSA